MSLQERTDRESRWSFEAYKLFNVFPDLMAQSNLAVTMSNFELYILLVCRVVDDVLDNRLESYRGTGVTRYFKFVDGEMKLKTSGLPYWQQVEAARLIRNGLVHAGGIVSETREPDKIRYIISSKSYLAQEHSHWGQDEEEPVVSIIQDRYLGDRIVLDNKYPWIISYYTREFFTDLCNKLM